MALNATRTGEAVAQALADADLLKGETEEELEANKAAAAAIWAVIAGAFWAELATYGELRWAQAAAGIAVQVSPTTGTGATTAAGTVTGGIQ